MASEIHTVRNGAKMAPGGTGKQKPPGVGCVYKGAEMETGRAAMPYVLAVAIIKTRSWFVKEVIRLDEYSLMIFTPYYDPSPPPEKVVANIMSFFL